MELVVKKVFSLYFKLTVSGKPTTKIIAETADMYAFLVDVLGAKYHD